MAHSKNEPRYYTYKTAPDAPALRGTGVTERMLRRAVELGRISYSKPGGQRVIFSSADLQEFIERSTVKAVR